MENGTNELIHKTEIRVTGTEDKLTVKSGDQGEVKTGRLGLTNTHCYI